MIKDGKYVLVLNLGLRSIRAIVIDDKGKKLSHSWLPVRTFIHDKKVEQDPKEWWNLALRVMDEATQNQEIKSKIGYITVTSSSCNLVMVNDNYDSLGMALMVSDKRAEKQAQELAENENLKQLFTSHNILPQSSFLIPKMLWIKNHDAEIFNKTRYFLSSDSFLLMKLTDNKIVSDPLNAEKSFYDIKQKSYPQEILSQLNISAERLAPVKDVGSEVGMLNSELQQQLGLSNVKVMLTTYDALAAFWGTGAMQQGEACLVGGTCSSLRVYSDNGLQQKTTGLLSQYFANEQAHIVGGSNNLAGGLLEWAKHTFYQDVQTNDDNYIFNLMEQEAATSPLGANGLIFLPYLIGERAPFFDSEVRGMFFGLEHGHTRKDIMRAIFEAVGFLSYDLINTLQKNNVPVNKLKLSGGLSKNDLVCQIKADITGKPVLLLDEAETTAFGCFVLLASKLSENKLSQQELQDLVPVRKALAPNSQNHEKYLQMYNFFKKLYHDNKENFKYRGQLLQSLGETEKRIVRNL